jgi:carboxylesterase
MKRAFILPGAEPFFFPGGATGCLLVHGFTGAPKEMRWLGEYLAKQGHSVLGVRLAGHATRPEDMIRNRWPDWLACVEDGWHLLSGTCDRIFVIGLSMGGMLALRIAAVRQPAGLVVIATPHHMPDDPRLRFIKLISRVKPFFPKGPPGWYDQEAYEEHISYPGDPTRGYAEVRDLAAEVQASLPQVRAPALLIYSRDDQTVRAEDGHMQAIQAGLGSQQIETMWVEGSGHVITEDAQRMRAFQAIGDFIARVNEQDR